MFCLEIIVFEELIKKYICIPSGELGPTGNPNVFQIWYVPVPSTSIIKIRGSGNNYNSFNCVADPDPGSGAFLTTVSRMGKKSGSGINTPDHIPRVKKPFCGLNT
jgi:hypothetical protein